jgi:hypothetical protein
MNKSELVVQAGTVEVNLAGLLLLVGAVMAGPQAMDLDSIMALLDKDEAADGPV